MAKDCDGDNDAPMRRGPMREPARVNGFAQRSGGPPAGKKGPKKPAKLAVMIGFKDAPLPGGDKQ